MGLFDAEDPDHTEALPAPGNGLPRRDPAGAADRTATRFGSGPAADSTAVAPSAPPAAAADATEIFDDDLVARAKRRMEFLGRNPAAESTQDFPMPAFTDETPIVDPPKSTPGTELVRYDPGRAEVPDRQPELTATTALDPPAPDSITDTDTALALREPAVPSASAAAAAAAAALAEQVRAAKIQRARMRRRVSIIAALTIVAIFGGVTTGYFAVNWFRDTNKPAVRSDPEHDPNGNQPPARTVAPDPTETDRSGGADAPTPSNSSGSRSATPKRSSAPATPRPTGTVSASPKPSESPSPTHSPTPSPTGDAA